MQQKSSEGGFEVQREVMVTDMIANLCIELATVFKAISRITKTCIGLKEQLVQTSGTSQTTPLSHSQNTTSLAQPDGDDFGKELEE